MNYGDIKSYVRNQLHRTDLTDALFDTWQEVVTSRVIRDVQFTTQITEVDWPITAQPAALPDDVDELLEVYVAVNGFTRKLRAVSPQQMRLYTNATGAEPQFYLREGNSLEISPGGDEPRTYTLRYRTKISSMVSDTDENELAAEHPQLIINGLMREAYWFTRDFEGVQAATETYNSEAEAVRKRSAYIQAGDNPEPNGASSWV